MPAPPNVDFTGVMLARALRVGAVLQAAFGRQRTGARGELLAEVYGELQGCLMHAAACRRLLEKMGAPLSAEAYEEARKAAETDVDSTVTTRVEVLQ